MNKRPVLVLNGNQVFVLYEKRMKDNFRLWMSHLRRKSINCCVQPYENGFGLYIDVLDYSKLIIEKPEKIRVSLKDLKEMGDVIRI